MAHCDLCGVTYLSERGHTCESVSGSTAIGFARATAAINRTHIAQAFPCPDCGQPKVTGSVCDTSRCRAREAPTPAAPAGGGWLTMTEDEYEEHIAGPMSGRTKYHGREPLRDERLLAEARAQRARAEAAERERDTISCNAIPTWPACEDGLDRQQHNDPVCWGCYSAEKAIRREVESQLSAATAREAALRGAIQPFLHPDFRRTLGGNTVGDDSPVFGRDSALLTLGDFRRLASLAAPEGGTTDG